MDERLIPAVEAMQARFNAQAREYRDEVTLSLPLEQVVPGCAALRDEFGFDMLIVETAVDMWPQEPRFQLVIKLYSFEKNVFIGLRAPVGGNDPHMQTLTGVYPNANWHERELWDMFGIHVDGHPDLRRILMPADWQGHPLRKDYPLGYEEVQFTFNLEDVAKRKPHPTN
jgi:NADH-quinone oxidoreductase subunit C